MGHAPRTRRSGVRRAVAGSVAVHLLLAGVAAVVLATRPDPRGPAPAGFDTRADDLSMRLCEVDLAVAQVEPAPTEPDPPPASVPPLPPALPPPSPPSRPRDDGRPSRLPPGTAVPSPLPGHVLIHIRRSSGTPATTPRPAPTVAPLHGAMKAGQAVVYVLDCSGSMGEFGKLAAARAALAATLRRQPGEVRFQVVAYNSTVRTLVPGGCVPASAANVAAAEAALAGLTPAGRSSHREAVQAAAALRPDVVVLLTDADDLSAAGLRPAGAEKSVPVWAARVTADGVDPPRGLR